MHGDSVILGAYVAAFGRQAVRRSARKEGRRQAGLWILVNFFGATFNV